MRTEVVRAWGVPPWATEATTLRRGHGTRIRPEGRVAQAGGAGILAGQRKGNGAMADTRVALVAGASGAAAAARVAGRASRTAGFEAVGLSRRAPPGGAPPWTAADLLDAPGLVRAPSARPGIAHVVHAARAPHAESGVGDVPGNLAMLRNPLDAAEAAPPRFARPHLVRGGRWHGMHIGPYRTPAREGDPRHTPPNLHYDQRDLVAERRRGKAWVWTAGRPGFVLDVAPGRARNMVSTPGAYAAVCRGLDVPFGFPGQPGAWDALLEVADAGLLAEGVLRRRVRDPGLTAMELGTWHAAVRDLREEPRGGEGLSHGAGGGR